LVREIQLQTSILVIGTVVTN